MIKKINQTFFTGVWNAGLNLITVWLTAKYLGEDGRGYISIFILNISFVQIFTAIVGSSAIIYLQSKHQLSNILLISGVWAIVISVLTSIVMQALGILQKDCLTFTILIALFQSLTTNNTLMLLGKKESSLYNLCRIVQPLLIIILSAIFLVLADFTVKSYIDALLYSSFSSFVVSSWLILNKLRFEKLNAILKTFKEFFKIGVINQFTNFVQLANYRFSFYLLASFWGLKNLGIFSLGVTLVEGIWIFKNSIALLHHSEISNEQVITKNILMKNQKLIVLSFVGTLALLLIAVFIPAKIYTLIFGKGFEDIGNIMLFISPGVLSISASTIIAYFFSGIGLVKYNTYSSCHGFVAIIVMGVLLIPQFGIIGAAIANACSYVVSSISLFYYFKKYLKKNSGNTL